MLTPNCRHLLDKLDGISSDVLWNLGDESIDVYSETFHELFNFVSKLHFEADREKILALIEYLSKELMHPSQPKYRKQGGLSGFVILTKALGKASASQLLQEILPPVLDTLHDSNISVRRFASDTIYEIARVVKRGIIVFFDRIVFVFSLLHQDSGTVPFDTDDILTKIVKFAATEDGELRCTISSIGWNVVYLLNTRHHCIFYHIVQINEFRKLGKHELASHYSDILAVILPCFSNTPENICEIAREINEGIREVYPDSAERSNINAVLSVLTRGLRFGWKDSQIEALRWIIELLSWHRAEVISYFSENFDSLMKALSDSSDEVVPLVLDVCARIVGDAEYFHRLFAFLVEKFHSDSLLERRGLLIVSHLCALLNGEQVYRKFSSLIEGEDNLEFASKFVQVFHCSGLSCSFYKAYTLHY
ncbi:putative vacuole morphology and inheritance protein [Dioscorea sansibarensis]